MSRAVVAIELVLENCEVIKLKYPDFVLFDVSDVYTSFGSHINMISKNQCVKGFEIGINKDADFSESSSVDGEMSIDRLKALDVTQLEVHYEDGASDHYMVNWDCEGEWSNEKQKYILTHDNNVLFTSHSGDNVLSEEDLETICSSVDFLCSMNK